MDEYITRNNAISAVCLGCNQQFSDEPCEPSDCTIRRSIMALPTADVAPRAEGAREIFEEIEKIIEKHHSECYEYEDGDECDTAITYISYLSVDIDDLKKKYTEGQTNDS